MHISIITAKTRGFDPDHVPTWISRIPPESRIPLPPAKVANAVDRRQSLGLLCLLGKQTKQK